MDEVRKAIEMGYVLVDVFEFCEYEVTCFDRNTSSGGLLAEYLNMFLKLKQESPSYPSWVQIVEDKDRHIEDYRRAEGIALDKASISKRNFGKTKIDLIVGQMGPEPKQDTENYCRLREIVRAFDMSGY